MPSRRLGPYQLIARLASGGGGHIFVARQEGETEGFARVVCLKTLLPQHAVEPQYVSAFFEEARLAALLSHPNCIQIYDVGEIDGVRFISMEFVVGETLSSLMSDAFGSGEPVPPQVAAALTAAVCDGLHHAHTLRNSDGRPLQLVHRDVSPPNVMISFEGVTKVLDFGIAKAVTGDDTKTGIVKGKACYMSPEQITGGRVDHRSDVYAAGVILFECLANQRLYPEASINEIAWRMHASETPRPRTFRPDVPAALDDIVARALVLDKEARFPSALDMSTALNAYLAEAGAATGRTVLAKHLTERYGSRRQTRHALIDLIREGRFDEKEVIEGLGARPVMALDLYQDGHSDVAAAFGALAAEPMTATPTPTPSGSPESKGRDTTAPEAWQPAQAAVDATRLESDSDPRNPIVAQSLVEAAETLELAGARAANFEAEIEAAGTVKVDAAGPSLPDHSAHQKERVATTRRMRTPVQPNAPELSTVRTLTVLAIGVGVGVGLGVVLTFLGSI